MDAIKWIVYKIRVMRKRINIILGALITLLSGCKTQKDLPVQSDRIMVLYGPPAYFQQQDTQQQDTLSQETMPENNSANDLIAK